MDEQLKALLEGINALKSGQEDTKGRMGKGQQKMLKGLDDTKNELKDRVEKDLENVQKLVEVKVAVVEEKIEKKVEKVEERIREQAEEKCEEVAGNFSLISQRVEDF
ncbi:hypothetical protein TNCV_1943131 [Trichonephila clavipes]|nr:hypothetical protein TNCV_1943131 [Trichonephila clavipes]